MVAVGHIKGSRRTEGGWTVLDKRYWPGAKVTDHLSFALRHEPIDLLILKRAFDVIPAGEMAALVRAAPTGVFARRAWFFCEVLTGTTLDIEDAEMVTAADALDPKACLTGPPRLSKRHRVRDNLLGGGDYCPMIRRTETLDVFMRRGLAQKAAETVGRTSTNPADAAARPACPAPRCEREPLLVGGHDDPGVDQVPVEASRARTAEDKGSDELVVHRHRHDDRALDSQVADDVPLEARVLGHFVEDKRLPIPLDGLAHDGLLVDVLLDMDRLRHPVEIRAVGLARASRSAAEVRAQRSEPSAFTPDDADHVDPHELLERARHGVHHARHVAPRARSLRYCQKRLVFCFARPTDVHGRERTTPGPRLGSNPGVRLCSSSRG